MRISIFFVCLILAQLGIGGKTFAQEELSLAQAIQIGLRNNFDVQITQRQEEIAERNNSWGVAGRWPTLGFDFVQAFTATDIDNPASFLQGTIDQRTSTPAINLNWTLFNGFGISLSKDRLDFLEQQSQGNTVIVLENTVQAIILAYNTVLLEQERLEVFKNTLDLSSDRYKYGLLKAELGSSVTFDILQDKNAYLTDSSNYILQRLSVKNAVRNLNLLLNVDIETEYYFTDDLYVNITDYNYDELAARMASSNSNLRNQYINQEILRKEVGIAKAPMYPSLLLGAGASRNWATQDLSGAEFLDGSNGQSGIKSGQTNYFANFTLAFTLFDGTRIRRQLQNAQIQEQIGLLQVDQLRRDLEIQLHIALDQYRIRKQLLSISQENVETTDLNLRLGEDRFRNGTLLSFNFRDLQRQYLLTALEYIQDRFDVVESNVELLRLTGGILSEYKP